MNMCVHEGMFADTVTRVAVLCTLVICPKMFLQVWTFMKMLNHQKHFIFKFVNMFLEFLYI